MIFSRSLFVNFNLVDYAIEGLHVFLFMFMRVYSSVLIGSFVQLKQTDSIITVY